MGNWSRKHDKCIECGTTTTRHIAKGLCLECYTRNINRTNRGKKQENRGDASIKLNRDYLLREYVENQRSLGDIAQECNCSRQFIFIKLKEFGINCRNKRKARLLALEKGKISFDLIDNNGKITVKTMKKIGINENFFSNWSDKMAYVLGVIFTDGNKIK